MSGGVHCSIAVALPLNDVVPVAYQMPSEPAHTTCLPPFASTAMSVPLVLSAVGPDEAVDRVGTVRDGDPRGTVDHLRRGAAGPHPVGAHAGDADGRAVLRRVAASRDERRAERPGDGDGSGLQHGWEDEVGDVRDAVLVEGDRVPQPRVVQTVGDVRDELFPLPKFTSACGSYAAGARDQGCRAREDQQALGHVGGNPSASIVSRAAQAPMLPLRRRRPPDDPGLPRRNRPVWESGNAAISSGGRPRPPVRPCPRLSGPRSTIQSAVLITSRLCSITKTVFPVRDQTLKHVRAAYGCPRSEGRWSARRGRRGCCRSLVSGALTRA